MCFFVWTDAAPAKVRQILAPVLKRFPNVNLKVGNQLPGIGAVPATTILALGNTGREIMEGQGLIPKKRTLTSLRNQVWKVGSTPTVFSYSTGIGEIDHARAVDLLTDTAAALRLHTTGKFEAELGQYRYVPNFNETVCRIEALYAKTGKPVDVALDLETVGLDPYLKASNGHPGAFIVSIQVSCEIGKSDVAAFPTREDWNAWIADNENFLLLEYILTSPKISLRGANLKYDLHWLAVHAHVECTNFRFDTTLVGSALDENRSNGLDIHAKIYAPELAGYSDAFDKAVDKSRMDLVLQASPEEFLKYAGGDTDACLRVAKAMKQELVDQPDLAGFYVNILHPAARAFEMVERGGVLIDLDAYNHLESELTKAMLELIAAAKKIVGGRIFYKHRDPTKIGELNLTKASFLIDFMFSPMGLNLKPKMMTESGDAPSTAEEHLMMFKDVPEAAEFVKILKAYGSAAKTMSTYVTGFRKHIRSDGRFHPSYWLFAGNKDTKEGGTVTGRLSCKDPAFQTIPKHTVWAKLLRKCFIAPEGYFILENDYSQGELRVIACVANEPVMIEAYSKNMDLHAVTSGRFAGFTYEEMMAMKNSDDKEKVDVFDSIRQLGKAGNFGLIYGMSEGGFEEYAEANYGVKLKPGEAGAFRDGFFDTYKALPIYHETYKKRASTLGYVTSPLGRVRHLPLINTPNRLERSKAERQAINSPIQSTLSDMMIWAIAIQHKQGEFKKAPVFGMVHDAGYKYIPQDNYLHHAKLTQEIMENLPFDVVGWKPQLKFVVDGKYGLNMADLKKVA